MRWVLCLLVISLCGCSFLAPGRDVREATEARNETTYDKEANFVAKEATTHNRRNVVAESSTESGTTLEFYPDGTPKKIQGASNVLSQSSDPKDAATAYMMLAQENARVAGEMLRTVQMLIPMLGQRSSGDGDGPRGPTLQELLDALASQGSRR